MLAAGAAPALKPKPASPWVEYIDKSDGRPYFYNPVTAETVWEMPPTGISPPPRTAREPGSRSPEHYYMKLDA